MSVAHADSPSLFLGLNLATSPAIGVAGGQAIVYSSRSPAKATDNEDSAAILPYAGDSAALLVCDGLGGQAGGQQASSLAVRRFGRVLEVAAEAESPFGWAMLEAIDAANRRVSELGTGAATTLSAVSIDAGQVRPYHVGDSMILIVGQRGRIKHQTIAHSPVGYAVEAGVLDATEAMTHDERHVVSNVVGRPEMRIEVGPAVELSPRDTLVIASDGLSDNLHINEIAELVRKGPLEEVAAALAAAVQARMTEPAAGEPSKPDDLTFILYRRMPS